MANQLDKVIENVEGAFFVDQDCIACDTCRDTAGAYFRLTEDHDHAFVYRQPTTEQGLKLCQKALDQCPVDSIGCNGVGL